MDARELGRRAALWHLKQAQTAGAAPGPAANLGTTVTKPVTSGAATATSFGAKPIGNAAPGPAVPKVAPAPAATRVAATPSAAQARPGAAQAQPAAAGGGIGGMLGGALSGLGTPQGLASIIGNPALKSIVEPMMQVGGLPLLAGGTNLALHGGADIQNIMKGRS
jgi:hypothetical protein